MTGPPEASAVPDRLVEREQWVCWKRADRNGKETKVPLVPGTEEFASTTDPADWGTLASAREGVASTTADGIGFVFTEDDLLVGVDLDDCRDPETGALDDDARDVVRRLGSFTEVSPSGTGLHVLVAGTLPEGRNRRGPIECYDRARYFTVTGDALTELPDSVAERSDELAAIHDEYLAETGRREGEPDTVGASTSRVPESFPDEELLQRARSAANGRKFRRLWNGRTSGHDSHSEADMALCCLLAFWTGGDADRIDRLFRRSGLFRDKWDEVHYADGSTYGERTIERAVDTTDEHYEPSEAVDEEKTIGDGEGSVDGTDCATVDESAAHLVERNRLLSERVERLEAELEARADRIAELEAEVSTDPLDGEDSSDPSPGGSNSTVEEATPVQSPSRDEAAFRIDQRSIVDRLRCWFDDG